MTGLMSSRMRRQSTLVATVLILTTIGLLVQVASSPLPLVVLGSKDTAQACVGVQISPRHVLVHSVCVKMKGPLTIARVMNPASAFTGNKTSSHVSLPIPIAIVNATAIPYEQRFANASAANLYPSSVESVHVVTFKQPLYPRVQNSVVLPLKMPVPAYTEIDRSAALVSVDLSSMSLISTRAVIHVADEACDHPVCVLPLEVEDRVPQTKSNRWSFLMKYDSDRDSYQLLGVGGDPVTDASGIWGFSWLPQVLSSSIFTTNDVYGVKTLDSVKKDIAGGSNVKKTNEFTEFIAGLRVAPEGETYCGAALIHPKWVLTSAGCLDIHTPTWVVIGTIHTSGKSVEAIKVKRMVRHSEYKVGSHRYNFMLVELEKASSRRQTRLDHDTPQTSEVGTAFGYGSVLYKSKRMNVELSSNKVSVLAPNDCPEYIRAKLDKTTMCVRGKISHGDYGGPMIRDAWTEKRVLAWVIGNDYKSYKNRNVFDYAVVGRVSSVYDWIRTVISKTEA